MPILRVSCVSIGILAAAMLAAQEPADLAVARALDQETLKLKDLSGETLSRAIRDLSNRIRQQPVMFAADLAFNLVVSPGVDEAAGHGGLPVMYSGN